MLSISVCLEDFPKIKEIADNHSNVYISFGVHPNEATEQVLEYSHLKELASSHKKVIAIGETGLDYFRSEGEDSLIIQQKNFITHMEIAKELQKPLIIHTRDARDDTLKMLKEHNAQNAGGIIHCFTEDWDFAKQALDIGFYISFSGIVTFKNAKQIQEVAKKIPLDRMLIETDSPYLAPVPHRGKPNFPKHVVHVAEYIADLRGSDIYEIGKTTTDNFNTLFNLKE